MLTTGKPLQVLSSSEEEIVLNEENLRSVLLHDDLKNIPISVISISGAYKCGKTLLLNLLLRCLQAKKQGITDWDNVSTALEVRKDDEFQLFAYGNESHTNGIWMWSEPFIVESSIHGKIAILLMDVESCLGCKSTDISASVFALSILTSSTCVINLRQKIDCDNLETLENMVAYSLGLLQASGDTKMSSCALQKLVLLVRDYVWAYEEGFGLPGGKRVLEQIFITPRGTAEDVQGYCKLVQSYFSKMQCFLLPSPGSSILEKSCKLTSEDLALQPMFIRQFDSLVKVLLLPGNLPPIKTENNTLFTGDLLLQQFIKYYQVLRDGLMPKMQLWLEEKLEKQHHESADASFKLYLDQMLPFVNEKHPVGRKRLEEEHELAKENAFDVIYMMLANVNQTKKCVRDVAMKIDEEYLKLKKELADIWMLQEVEVVGKAYLLYSTVINKELNSGVIINQMLFDSIKDQSENRAVHIIQDALHDKEEIDIFTQLLKKSISGNEDVVNCLYHTERKKRLMEDTDKALRTYNTSMRLGLKRKIALDEAQFKHLQQLCEDQARMYLTRWENCPDPTNMVNTWMERFEEELMTTCDMLRHTNTARRETDMSDHFSYALNQYKKHMEASLHTGGMEPSTFDSIHKDLCHDAADKVTSTWKEEEKFESSLQNLHQDMELAFTQYYEQNRRKWKHKNTMLMWRSIGFTFIAFGTGYLLYRYVRPRKIYEAMFTSKPKV